ncbi:hypothetical protein [Streptomyces sp. H27-C3]|uniref:DUF6895 family protein n=1 Tax=Streptomyces sp. H27-C3 TaxID=3046305 RepID=UPI0024BB57E6|nr:hypothetical protein [Streptomyces sp. H27-C3]MDJ0466967.1 hypothetical protein [Streptomyces sp. H27-C3]
MTSEVPRGVAEAAAGWLWEHREGFRLGQDALAAHGDVNRTWKPLGELAQVCVPVLHHTPVGTLLHESAAGLLDFAWQETGQGAVLNELQRLEPFATYPLEIYAAFTSGGLRHAGFEQATALVAATRGWRGWEQVPTRKLGVLNSERRAGLAQHDTVSAALERTWLASLAEPWVFDREVGYTLTHTVFHLTDWGHDAQGVPPYLADYLELWLPAWLATCMEDDQWDLSCELLAVAANLPRLSSHPDTDTEAEADTIWETIAAAQTGGCLPEVGPGPLGRAMAQDFTHCYHSTLMALFAGALTSARPPMGNTHDPGGDGRQSFQEARGQGVAT